MAKKAANGTKRPIETYEHKGKHRVNNPPVGLVTPDTDPDAGTRKTYAYDPHLDPQLQWAGKAEHTSFEIPTVSLHVHERIEPRTIIEAVKKRNVDNGMAQPDFFEQTEENPPLREAIDFYHHAHGWSNRMVAGDSLLVMNSLLEKEGMAGKVQMVYLDPPYGIKYGSNFQPFVNKRDVKDGKDEDLTAEPEQIRAFRDTWELGIHSYLTYLRDRLLLARELLTESGSVFVQISDDNVHHVREIMDEVFGAENFVGLVTFTKTGGASANLLASVADYLLWYGKEKGRLKYRQIYLEKRAGEVGATGYAFIENIGGNEWRPMTKAEREDPTSIPQGSKIFDGTPLMSTGATPEGSKPFEFKGTEYRPPANSHWKTGLEGLKRLAAKNRIIAIGNRIEYKRYLDDFPVYPINNIWIGMGERGFVGDKLYVVQTDRNVIQRCLLMTTDPGDLVFDPTCGSGTTASVAEQWGRRWITCDTSRVALTLAKQRLMTAVFDYYELAHPQEGVGSGFNYKTVPHVMLKSIANNEPPVTETLYDQPISDNKKKRVSGPFTVEAVPAPAVKSVEDVLGGTGVPPVDNHGRDGHATLGADNSIARSGETLRQGEWRDELLRTGIRGKAGQHIRFARLEPLPGCRHLHADGETLPNDDGRLRIREKGAATEAQRIVVSFGPEHAPLEQRQVAQAIEEAHTLVPKPKLIVFATFQFDPEAAKDIDETNWPGVTLLKAQMNADLLTDDLKKKRASNESFWLIGQPDVELRKVAQASSPASNKKPRGGAKKNAGGDASATLYQVEVKGFDYYNTRTGGIESGGAGQIALWMLDTDYDGRSLYPRQVFFPQAGEKEGWARLAKNLKAEIDEELIEAYRGSVSLSFAPGEHQRIAVKIVDDRGIESLKVMEVGDGH